MLAGCLLCGWSTCAKSERTRRWRFGVLSAGDSFSARAALGSEGSCIDFWPTSPESMAIARGLENGQLDFVNVAPRSAHHREGESRCNIRCPKPDEHLRFLWACFSHLDVLCITPVKYPLAWLAAGMLLCAFLSSQCKRGCKVAGCQVQAGATRPRYPQWSLHGTWSLADTPLGREGRRTPLPAVLLLPRQVLRVPGCQPSSTYRPAFPSFSSLDCVPDLRLSSSISQQSPSDQHRFCTSPSLLSALPCLALPCARPCSTRYPRHQLPKVTTSS